MCVRALALARVHTPAVASTAVQPTFQECGLTQSAARVMIDLQHLNAVANGIYPIPRTTAVRGEGGGRTVLGSDQAVTKLQCHQMPCAY